jgi:hypothetical protein
MSEIIDKTQDVIDWNEAVRISDLPAIVESIDALIDSPSEDNAACLIRKIANEIGREHSSNEVAEVGPVALDSEDYLRISKSGYSVKVGWNNEKRIIAKCPYEVGDMKGFGQWMLDAERLCDGWNRQSPSFHQAAASMKQKCLDELADIKQAFNEIQHAQSVGADWYSKGERGLFQQVRMWLQKGREAVARIEAIPTVEESI